MIFIVIFELLQLNCASGYRNICSGAVCHIISIYYINLEAVPCISSCIFMFVCLFVFVFCFFFVYLNRHNLRESL